MMTRRASAASRATFANGKTSSAGLHLTWKKQLSADFADYCDGTNLSEHARGTVSAPAPDRSLHAAAIIENSYDIRPATKSTQRDCKLARRYRRFSGGTQMNQLVRMTARRTHRVREGVSITFLKSAEICVICGCNRRF